MAVALKEQADEVAAADTARFEAKEAEMKKANQEVPASFFSLLHFASALFFFFIIVDIVYVGVSLSVAAVFCQVVGRGCFMLYDAVMPELGEKKNYSLGCVHDAAVSQSVSRGCSLSC